MVLDNIECLKQGQTLIDSIDDRQYVSSESRLFKLGGIGKHFRHIVDFYSSFLRANGDVIDYECRARDTLIETDARRAKQKISEIIETLETDPQFLRDLDTAVSVAATESSSYSETARAVSSLGRELQFLISHTTHHYAIIAMILRELGAEPPADFGVAPSTLRYLQSQKA